MRYSKEHKEETRKNIMAAALGKFRTAGFHGVGVDGISKAAGVTSGAFYKHFESKSAAFRSIVSEGLGILRAGIGASQADNGENWINSFMKWYFTFPDPTAPPAQCGKLPLEGGCALPTLAPEVARTDPETQRVFEQEISEIIALMSQGLPKNLKNRQRISWTLLALMVGGVVLARSVHDDKTAREISSAVLASARQLTR